MIILPTISWGGGPPKAVEGFFCAAVQNPSTMQSSLHGPPPRQMPGRM